MVLVVLLSEVLKDATRFEQAYLLSISKSVRHGWDASIWVDFEKPWLFLSIFADINMLDFVRLVILSVGALLHQ